MKHMTYLTAVLLAMIVAAPATAQDVTQTDLQAELRSMVSETTPADRDRAAVQDFLDRGDVADVAESWGIDMEQLHDRVNTLGAGAAASLAERVETTENQLDQVGGDTFVVSTTAVIIGLLIAILIIVA